MQMTGLLLDIAFIAIIVISTLVGLSRGFIRESFSLASWVVALAFTVLYFQKLAEMLPFEGLSQVARIGVAAVIIFFCVLIIGAVISYIFKLGVSAIGLGGVDHFFGALLGLLRGGLIVILVVLLAGAASLPQKTWWQNSHLVPQFESSAEWVKVTAMEKLSPIMERFAASINAQ